MPNIVHFNDLPWRLQWRRSVQLLNERQREFDDAIRSPNVLDYEAIDLVCWRLQCARNQLARVGKGWRRALRKQRLSRPTLEED